MARYNVPKRDAELRQLYHSVCNFEQTHSGIALELLYSHHRKLLRGKTIRDLRKILASQSDYFDLCHDGSVIVVRAHTELELCEEHGSKSGCDMSHGDCGGLHLCKFYILGSCHITPEDLCQYGHRLDTDHNEVLLAENMLDGMPILTVISLLRKKLPPPRICKFYNVVSGCRSGDDGRKCPWLHICKYYLRGESCKFGVQCKRSHNIFDPQPAGVLQKHGFDMTRKPNDLLQELRKAYSKLDPEPSSPQTSHSCSDLRPPTQDFTSMTNLRIPVVTVPTQIVPPTTCKFYNVVAGCKKGLSCYALHICRHFLQNDCTFGSRCKRSHNIFDAQPKMILSKHGFNVNGNINDVLFALRNSAGVVDNPKPLLDGVRPAPISVGARPKRELFPQSTTKSDHLETHEICTFNLRGKCSYGRSCRNIHSQSPFQWQYCAESGDWMDIVGDANRNLEVNFCEPSCNGCTMSVDKLGPVQFNLVNMEATVNQMRVLKVRRLSTQSSVLAPENLKNYATEWRWFFRDHNDSWKEYGEMDEDSVANLRSSAIEQAYQDSPKKLLSFQTNNFKYILDFSKMEQSNLHPDVKTIREVRRRPAIPQIKHGGIENDAKTSVVPASWTKMSSDDTVLLEKIHKTGDTQQEYLTVANRFQETMSCSVRSIRRIQNVELWEDFMRKKRKMQKLKDGLPEEHLLFHGSRKEYEAGICQQGFDWRHSGKSVGAIYGQGSYFHKNAKYSRDYTDYNTLFVARVLVGDYAKGGRELRLPPVKRAGIGGACDVRYDSCVDSVQNPSIYVVFESAQVYPEYLIEFDP